jgi:hypothetical protein
MDHGPVHELSDAVAASRAWMATLEELGAMPANAFAEAIEACPAQNTHPRANLEADEEQLRKGMERLSTVI